jgi:integrase
VLELLAHYWTMLKEDGHLPREGAQSHPRALAFRWAVQPLRDLYPGTPAADFGPRALRKVRVTMIEQRLSRSTINARINLIQRVFRWGASMELIPVDIHRALTTLEPIKCGQFPELDSRPVEPVPEADVVGVLPHLSRQVATMVQLQWLTAMRPGEVCAMRMGEIDRDGPKENGVQLWIYQPAHHKTAHHGRVRVIPLGPRCQELLQPFLGPDEDAYLFSPAEAEADRNSCRRLRRATPRWPSHERFQRQRKEGRPDRVLGECYDVHAYRRAIERGCGKAGIRPWTPNRLRHSAATRIRQTHGIEAARVLLGHVSASTTEIYAQLDRQQAIRIMAEEG